LRTNAIKQNERRQRLHRYTQIFPAECVDVSFVWWALSTIIPFAFFSQTAWWPTVCVTKHKTNIKQMKTVSLRKGHRSGIRSAKKSVSFKWNSITRNIVQRSNYSTTASLFTMRVYSSFCIVVQSVHWTIWRRSRIQPIAPSTTTTEYYYYYYHFTTFDTMAILKHTRQTKFENYWLSTWFIQEQKFLRRRNVLSYTTHGNIPRSWKS